MVTRILTKSAQDKLYPIPTRRTACDFSTVDTETADVSFSADESCHKRGRTMYLDAGMAQDHL
jgi:hypothetical protein